MLIYSPSLEIYPTSQVGSQLDIAPTLLNLSTPKSFIYYSFGEPLFSTQKQSKLSNRIFNAFELVGDNHFVYTQYLRRIALKDYSVVDMEKSDAQAKKMLQRLKEGRALSWYLFSKGNIIDKQIVEAYKVK